MLGFPDDPGSHLAGILRLALMRVELFLDGRLRVPHVRVSRELGIAIFTDSEHWNVPDSFYDPKIALGHKASFPQAGFQRHPGGFQTAPLPRGLAGCPASDVMYPINFLAWGME